VSSSSAQLVPGGSEIVIASERNRGLLMPLGGRRGHMGLYSNV
jgi:hypothetical protein